MSNINLFRPLLVQGLLKVGQIQREYDFKSWAASGKYQIKDIPNKKNIEIDVFNEFDFYEMLAFDSSRMASASFESILTLGRSEKFPKSSAWIAVQTYYAAFFSAHAIMRYFGYICSHLERGHVDLFNTYFAASGGSTNLKIEGGLFTGRYHQHNRLLKMDKSDNPHEGTWQCFYGCLKTVSVDVLCVPGISIEKAAISAEIDELADILSNNGRLSSGNFLSIFRNDINYRHRYSAWFPYGKNSIASSDALHILKHWRDKETPRIGSSNMPEDVHKFYYGCVRTIHLSKLLMELILTNCINKHSIFDNWPNKLVS